MIGKKYRWIPLILMLLTSTAMVSVVVQAHPQPSPVSIYVKMPNDFIPGVAIGDFITVEVWINSTADAGVVATGISLAWDPAVLELGYTYWSSFPPPGFWVTLDQEEGTFFTGQGFTTTFLDGAVDQAAGTVTLTSDAISAWADLPHGSGANGTGPVVTYWFTSKSAIDYSPLTLVTAEFGTHDGTFDADDVEHGHYNEPPKVAPDVLLAGKKAWAEHNRFKRIKDGDPLINDRHGTAGFQTLYAKIKNYGTTYATVRAAFYLKGTYVADPIYTGGETFAPGDIKTLTANCWSFAPGEEGYWDVTAEYQVYNVTTSAWESGTPVKTFRFRVVP